jgi:hypothetical protein
VENSLIARFNSLLHRKNFPVPMRREFPRNSLDLRLYLASLYLPRLRETAVLLEAIREGLRLQ